MKNVLYKNNEPLLDKGFDKDYDNKTIQQFGKLFISKNRIQKFVNKLHIENRTIDIKRGEFYPEILRSTQTLKNTIAKKYLVSPEQCHPNFGSNGSIDTILMGIKLREIKKNINKGILVSTPTYFRNYNSALSKNLKLIKVPLKADWNVNTNAFIKQSNNRTPTGIFIVTPNNPTGIPIPDEDLIKIITNVPKSSIIVIDRTLANIKKEISTRELLKSFKDKDLVILHSFSKYFGMSHLRIGFAIYSNIQFAKEIEPLLPLGIGIEGAVKGINILRNKSDFSPSKQVTQNIIKNKKILSSFCLHNSNFDITDFSGNYCLLILKDNLNSEKIVKLLEKSGLYVMSGLDFPEPNNSVIRLHTGGDPNYMLQLTKLLEKIS